jgi:outer membrane protein assembly factor BamB
MKFYHLLLFFLYSIIIISPNAFTQDLSNNEASGDSSFQINDSTVQKVWEVNNDTTSSSGLVLSDNNIYSTLDEGLIYCYDLIGKEKWVAEVFGDLKSNTVQYKDLLLVSTVAGDLYSINANNGDVVQVMGIGDNVTTQLELIDIINGGYKSKAVVFGTELGTIYCYDIFSFELIWKVKLNDSPLVSNPLSVDDKIFFKDSVSTIYSVNSKTGLLIWKNDLGKNETGNENQNNSTLTDGKNIIVLLTSGEVVAIDLLNGKINWSIKKMDVIPQIQISNDKQKLILLNKKGELIFLSSKDGKEIGKMYLKKENITSFCYDDTDSFSLLSLSDGSVFKIDDKFILHPILNLEKSFINTIKILTDDQFIMSTQNGKILLYKFD